MGTAIIYATGFTKNTKGIADYMARELKADVFNLKQITKINLTDFDDVIFGSPLQGSKPLKPVVEFIENNRDALKGKRLVMFLDCKAEGEKIDAARDSISSELGINEVVCINSKGEMNEAGIPVAVDEFIARI